jgi:type III secretion system low calcium response chaperone LcrH/SycD
LRQTKALLEKFSSAGLLPKGEPIGFSLQEQENLYAGAFALYESGKFSDAAEVFTQLILCNPFVERSWRGLAAAQQLNEKFEEALHAWALTALLNSTDPLPHYHAAECLFSLDNREEALKALNEAEKLLGKDSTSEVLRSKIALLKGTS